MDELTGLKKLLATLEGKDEHSKTIVSVNGSDVTKSWIESLKWEIASLESRITELKNAHAQRS
ncbi:MAG: hypothetical protein WCF20_00525 [Methylovirgula sp.]